MLTPTLTTQNDPHCHRCGLVRSLHSAEPPYCLHRTEPIEMRCEGFTAQVSDSEKDASNYDHWRDTYIPGDEKYL